MLTQTLVVSLTALIGLAIVTAAALHGWTAWLAMRARELELHAGPGTSIHLATCGQSLARIEMADLRERVRKLEDIAAGIDV